MIITFQEKDNQKYEIDNADTDKIFEDMKDELFKMLEKYRHDDVDLITAILSLGCITDEMQQSLSDRYGADKIIQITNAKKLGDTQ